MISDTLKNRLKNTFLRPRQLILLDSHGGNPSRSFNVRLITLFITAAALLLVSFIGGFLINPGDKANSLVLQHLQLQRQYDQMQADLAEANAVNELQGQQLESLKDELLKEQGENNDLNQRVQMYESILEARKSAGLHLLNSEVKWVSEHELQYDFTLVKGGSYPRWEAGSIVISAQNPDGETVELLLNKDSSRLPFRVETHTFLHGHAEWKLDWRPEKLNLVAYDNSGKELLQSEILVDGAAK